MTLRKSFLLALPMALVLTALVQAPAAAAYRWQTLYETPRHIKAQACQLTYRNSQGYYVRSVKWRADARSASLGGSVQFRNSGGRGPYTSGWVSFKKGTVSKVTGTGFLQNEAATVYLRVKTSKGTSRWSPGRAVTSLRTC